MNIVRTCGQGALFIGCMGNALVKKAEEEDASCSFLKHLAGRVCMLVQAVISVVLLPLLTLSAPLFAHFGSKDSFREFKKIASLNGHMITFGLLGLAMPTEGLIRMLNAKAERLFAER